MPALSPNAIGPDCNESTERIPEPVVYCTAPPSTLSPPMKDEVALGALVSIENIGSAVVEVARVQEYC